MLQKIRLKRFKSFSDQEIQLSPLTICVGANASGKSNLFDAIRFLQGAGEGLLFRDIFQGVWKGGREVWPGLRGGAQEAVYGDATDFELATVSEIQGIVSNYVIGCQSSPVPLLMRETLRLPTHKATIFDTASKTLGGQRGPNEGGEIRVALPPDGQGTIPISTHSASRSLLGQLRPVHGMDPGFWSAIEAQQKHLESAYFLDITPSRMRGYVSKQVDQLGAEGEHLSGVLWNMTQREAQAEQDIVDWLTELCAQEFSGLDFVETELGDVMLEVIEQGGQRVSARSLSDGTLRFLGLVVALLTTPAGSLLLLEEIENGLHPSRVHLLVQLVEEITAQRDVQVIATTHSAQVLESLSRENLMNAVLFARQEKNSHTPGTVMRRFADIPDLSAALKKKPIEDLYLSRWLENVLWMS